MLPWIIGASAITAFIGLLLWLLWPEISTKSDKDSRGGMP